MFIWEGKNMKKALRVGILLDVVFVAGIIVSLACGWYIAAYILIAIVVADQIALRVIRRKFPSL